MMEKLKQYQFKIYEQLYPLVINKMDRLQQIQVPLSQELNPTSRTNEKSVVKSEEEMDSKSDIDAEQEINENDNNDNNQCDSNDENDDIDSEQLERILESNSESVTDSLKSDKHVDDDRTTLSQGEEKSDSIQDPEVSTSSLKQDQGNSTGDVNQKCEDRKEESDKDVIQSDISDSECDNERNDLIQEMESIGENRGENENIESGEDMTERDLEDVTCDVLHDLEVAMEKGEKVQRQLKKTTDTEFIKQISKDYDKYTEEDMDDLLDEIMEEDENNDSGSDLNQSDLKDEEIISDTNQSNESLPISQSKESKSTKKVKSCDKSDQSETDGLSDKNLAYQTKDSR
ncbi:hypothetical protein KUTeg_019127 [Tegillarca granosa]|uniref:Uncharacterized protein n=1 Tax=Tegillarca granosa TaxID=220873 RepID=A0ABQ9EE85_TEGGR|nr:hypothetical protein KUTeg_019127 [Tegillarca granosa]